MDPNYPNRKHHCVLHACAARSRILTRPVALTCEHEVQEATLCRGALGDNGVDGG